MRPEPIPLVDLLAQYRAHKEVFDAALERAVAQASFVGGPDRDAFASEFADWCGGGHVVPVANGTDALEIVLCETLGRGDGEAEIITVSHTFIATAEAIVTAGYRPVFTDIDPDTFLMDLDDVERRITDGTRAIVPVHLYGQMVNMPRLMDIAGRHGIPVIEDSAQAHGARFADRQPGALSTAATYSFYPGKNLGAWGDAGAIYTRDAELARRMDMHANHGRTDKYEHKFLGRNSRLDGMQAAILRAKLPHLADWNARRRDVAAWYDERLRPHANHVGLPTVDPAAEPVYHLYVVKVEDRDAVLQKLKRQGIGAGIHYPIPMHRQPACARLNCREEDYPHTNAIAGRILSLPIFPEMTRDQVDRVTDALIAAVGVGG